MNTVQRGNVLVTGGTGFIGYHLCRQLIEAGCNVTAIVRHQSDTAGLASLGLIDIVHWSGSVDELIGCMHDRRPLVVYHLASQVLAEHRLEDLDKIIDANILFGLKLLEAMTAVGVNALVNTGTSWQHYGQTVDYRPANLYAASKQAFEDLIAYYADARGLRTITLKFSDTYGPQDRRGKLISQLMRLAKEGGEIYASPGEQEIDLLHIDDVVRGYLIAGNRCLELVPGRTECFALSGAEPMTVRQLADLIVSLSGTRLAIHWGGRPYRTREVMRPWRSGTPLPDWEPRVRLRDGLSQLLSDS
jgi:nucleoside-diphosphate-sugar epimerase